MRLTEEVKRRVDQLAAINTVATTVSQSLDLNVTLEVALDAVLSVIRVEAAGISLIDEEAGELVLMAQRGWVQDFVTEKPMRIKLGKGISGQVLATDDVVITGSLAGDDRLAVPAFGNEPVQAMAMAPMHAHGKIVGILSVISHHPYTFSDGEITVLCAIADQVGVALDNARLYERVREEQARLSAVVQSAADAIIATDSHSRINLFNRAAERLFQVGADDVLGRPLFDSPLPRRVLAELRRAMARVEGREGSTVIDLQMENGEFWSGVISPVYAPPGHTGKSAEGWVIVMQNVSHLKEAERSRVQFVQSAAHDLRNPLGTALSAMAMLQSEFEMAEDMARILEIAIDGIVRMQDLIDELLNLEHIESGVGMKHQPVDLSDLLTRTGTEMVPLMAEHHHSFTLELEPDLPPVLGDARWLRRALENLLANAIKYTPDGGKITLRAFTSGDGKEVTLEVEDNGPGIPPDAQVHLFERFYRVAVTEDVAPGTGLGLAIVKSVAEKHGGRVFVRSKVGEGSTFGLVLPVGQVDDECH